VIVPSYENFRVLASIRRYGATPARGKDGRFVFPDVVRFAPDGDARAINRTTQPVNSVADALLWPWRLTTNDLASDAAARVQEWDWFLWHEAGFLEIARLSSETLSDTVSGTVVLRLTAAGFAALGIAPSLTYNLTEAQVERVTRASYAYAQERATGDVYVFNLAEIAAGNAPSTQGSLIS
jgi:hypothetical protein